MSTSPDLKTHQVTARNLQGIPIDLVLLPSNAWSLQGLLPGVYTLGVNVAMSTSGILGTYETILVILEPNQQPLPPTTIINQITIRQPDRGCPGNMTLINGTCQSPPPRNPPQPGPGRNDTEPIICPTYIYYGKDPCAFDYIPPNENSECPEGYEFVDEDTGCIPEGFLNPPTAPIACPEGQTGIPPNCQPINCDVENSPPECEEQPVVCPDGSTVSRGNECPEPPPENGVEQPPENGPPEGGDGEDGGNGDGGNGDGGNGDGGNGDGGNNNGGSFGGDSFFD